MNVAEYLARQYAYPPCWALVEDVQARECANPTPHYVADNASSAAIAGEFRRALHAGGHGFVRIAAPVDYCIVLMARRAAATPHHCGIYYAGKVLHALVNGTMHQDLASLGDSYARIEFWARP